MNIGSPIAPYIQSYEAHEAQSAKDVGLLMVSCLIIYYSFWGTVIILQL